MSNNPNKKVPLDDMMEYFVQTEKCSPEEASVLMQKNAENCAKAVALLYVVNISRFGESYACVFRGLAEAAFELSVGAERGIQPNDVIGNAMQEANAKNFEQIEKHRKNGTLHKCHISNVSFTENGEVVVEKGTVDDIKENKPTQ